MSAAESPTESPYGRSLSLPLALEAIARSRGIAVDREALCAVMGLSLMVCSPRLDEPLRNWPLFARDIFLVEAARLFGLHLRDVHPPEAARGLAGFPEFGQHFDASYRPLIRNALVNGQAVLAWRGWRGDDDWLWGRIDGEGADGVGLVGSIFGVQGDRVESVLMSPPVQLYVVERIEPEHANPRLLLNAACDHAARVVRNEVGPGFPIVSGPPAFEQWVRRIQQAGDPGRVLRETAELAEVFAQHHRSAVSFFERCTEVRKTESSRKVGVLLRMGREVLAELEALSDEATFEPGRAVARLETARRSCAKVAGLRT